MNVVHISTYDEAGGAARSAYRLHDGLLRIKLNSSMFVEHRGTMDPKVVRFEPPTDFVSRLRRRIRREKIIYDFSRYKHRRPNGCEIFTDDRTRHSSDLLNQIPSCDVLNLHWIAEFVDYDSFFLSVPQRIPVIWTLHDMNAFTGGCHYDMGCKRYTNHCGSCPEIGSQDPRDLSRQILERKRRVFEQVPAGRLHIVTPSRWLAEEVKQSFLNQICEVSIIPYGLDLSVFAPRDRRAAREVLGIPLEVNVVLFVAYDLRIERKGHRLLAEAIGCLRDLREKLFLLSIGFGAPAAEAGVAGMQLEYLDNDRLLSLIYSAADLFVITSRQDNLPNTVLEAMACGVPVVGFDVGGIPDMVRSDVTGLLVPAFDVKALGSEIMSLLENPSKRVEMAANCRRVAEEEYGLELQARQYRKLYERMVGSRL